MGLMPRLISPDVYSYSDGVFYSTNGSLEEVSRNMDNYVKYSSDYNWLMEVVCKIESIEDGNNCAKYNFIIEQSFIEIIDNHTSEEIIKLDRGTKKEAIYNACIEFIKWYNQQSK
jgi:hypothetical protein